jgi:phosphate starvation-inducible membrane PsiE
MILGDKPVISEVVLSQLVPEQDWGKTHMKASKNRNNIFGEERLAHIRTLLVFLGGKLTYVLIYATTELHQRRYVVILECLSYFIVDDLILLFVAL